MGCESVHRGYDFRKPAFEGKGGFVEVVEGDTVYKLSQRLKVPMRALITANNLSPPYILPKGTKLVIPKRLTYKVQKGDTLYAIAKAHSVNFQHLAKFNNLKNASYIKAGQVLYLPDNIVLPSATPKKATVKPATSKPALKPTQGATKKATQGATASQGASKKPAEKPTEKATEKATKKPTNKPRVATKPRTPTKKPRTRTTASKGFKGFQWPLRGKILSNYGSKGGGLYNDGINIGAKRGSKVTSIQAGEVVYAGNELRGYGNLVLVKHQGGWVSAYAHNQAIKVRQGVKVNKGDTIALAGNSGSVKTPQLHFELRLNGKSVNPRKYLPKI